MSAEQFSLAQISNQLRIKFFLTGVLFPVGCLVLSGLKLIPVTTDEAWQSGRIADYAVMLIGLPGFATFLPFIAFSAVTMAIWTIRPEAVRFRAVRIGIVGGPIISLQFLLMAIASSGIATIFFTAIVGPSLAIVVLLGYGFVVLWDLRRFAIRHLLIFTGMTGLLLGFIKLVGGWEIVGEVILKMTLAICGATPLLCFVTYVRASRHVLYASNPQHSWPTVAAFSGWMIAWIASWKFAIDIMLDEYSKLPTTELNCFVSGVAAKGHRRLVGSGDIRSDGERVNCQMKRL